MRLLIVCTSSADGADIAICDSVSGHRQLFYNNSVIFQIKMLCAPVADLGRLEMEQRCHLRFCFVGLGAGARLAYEQDLYGVVSETTVGEVRRIVAHHIGLAASQMWLYDEFGHACALRSALLTHCGCVLLDMLEPEIAQELFWDIRCNVVLVGGDCRRPPCRVQWARYKCAGCARVRYCSEACRTDDWRAHREYCKVFQSLEKQFGLTDPGRTNIQLLGAGAFTGDIQCFGRRPVPAG